MNRHEDGQEAAPLPPTLLEEKAKTAFDIFSFMPFRRTPMEVTVKHNTREMDFDKPQLSADLSATSDETPDFDEEEADYLPKPHCFDLAHIFGLDNEDRATLEASSQYNGSRGTFDDEAAIKAQAESEQLARGTKGLCITESPASMNTRICSSRQLNVMSRYGFVERSGDERMRGTQTMANQISIKNKKLYKEKCDRCHSNACKSNPARSCYRLKFEVTCQDMYRVAFLGSKV